MFKRTSQAFEVKIVLNPFRFYNLLHFRCPPITTSLPPPLPSSPLNGPPLLQLVCPHTVPVRLHAGARFPKVRFLALRDEFEETSNNETQ
jgi:hypothetical protein